MFEGANAQAPVCKGLIVCYYTLESQET
jgi:hypothetical protein